MASRPDEEPGQPRFDELSVPDLADAVGRDPSPDPAEHERLLAAAGRGDTEARESLTRAHLDWVLSAARERVGRGLSEGDLFQEGTIGLIEAIRQFTTSGRSDFEAYARQQVADHMEQALGDEEKAVRDREMLLQAAHEYVEAELTIRQDFGRPASNLELATKLEWSSQRTEQIGLMVADARRRHDEEILQFVEPDDIDLDGLGEDHPDRDGS
jgi:RNA polymerase sigma factor (sigma-70 family)